MDRIVEIMGSEGERKSYTYDALGNVTSMTDGEGNTTWYAYTLSGQLAKVTDALGNETEYQYDVCDRLIEIRQYGADGSLLTQQEEETEWKKPKAPDHPLYQRPAGTGHRNDGCTGTEGNLYL